MIFAAASPDPVLAAVTSGAQMAMSGSGSSAVKIFLLMTALSFGSALLVSLTSFTRIIIVFSFLRQAIGTPSLPPNQVLMGLSLFLTMFIMAPTVSKIQTEAFEPLMDDKITVAEAMKRAEPTLAAWLLKQTREDDLKLFLEISNRPAPERGEAIPITVLAPAFMIPELGTAFRMGLYIFLPMLLIDLLVASVLMALGMMMVPPTLISLSLKLAVFLLAGGWHLLVSSLVRELLMSQTLPGHLMREGLGVLAAVGLPVLGALLIMGLIVGILQSATQINDPAVGFLPRLVAGAAVVLFMGGWILERLAKYFQYAMERISEGM